MSVVKINAITVPADGGDELARRFAGRAGAVDNQDGFEEFQLLRPADGRDTWLVYTRWRDEDAFQAWVNSAAFQHGHRGARGEGGANTDTNGGGHPHGGAGGSSDPAKPVATNSELWAFTVEQHTARGATA